MSPRRELDDLAARKLLLRARIAHGRVVMTLAAERAARPLRWADRLHAQWQAIPPPARVAALAGFVLALRVTLRRMGRHLPLLRWTPLVLQLLRAAR